MRKSVTCLTLLAIAPVLAVTSCSSNDGHAGKPPHPARREAAVPYDRWARVAGGLTVKVDRYFGRGSDSGCYSDGAGGSPGCDYMITFRNDGDGPRTITLSTVALLDTKNRTYSADADYASAHLPATLQPEQVLTSGSFDQPGLGFRFVVSATATPDHLTILGRTFKIPKVGPAAAGPA